MATEARTARAALRQASVRWPGRSTAADGILPSAAHSRRNPRSRHEQGNAFDLTHDPGHGVDCSVLARYLVARAEAGLEDRCDEVIWDHRIATAKRGWTWRRYSGSNPHDHHMHVSIRPEHRDDVSPWWSALLPEPPAPERPPVHTLPAVWEDDMPVIARTKSKPKAAMLTDLLTSQRSIDSTAELDELKALGVRDVGVVSDELLADVPVLRG